MDNKKIINNLKKIIKNHYYFKSDSYWRNYVYQEINMLSFQNNLNTEWAKKLFNDALNKALEVLRPYIQSVTPFDLLNEVCEEELNLLKNSFYKVWAEVK